MDKTVEYYKQRQLHPKIAKRKLWLITNILQFIDEKDSVIDIGCGDCVITSWLSLYCKILGCDLDVSIQKAKYPFLKLCNYNISSQEYHDKKYDVALMLDVLEHIDFLNMGFVINNLRNLTKRLLIINIPIHQDKEQIIDNKIDVLKFVSTMNEYCFELQYLQRYNFNEEKYCFMVFNKGEI